MIYHYYLDARTATAHFPGIGRYVRSLAVPLAGLLDASERLSVLCDPSWPLPEVPRASLQDATASPFGLAQQWAIPPRLRRAAVYHSPYYLMPYRPGVPTVLTVYDLIPTLFPQTVSLRARLLFMLATRLALRTAAHVIAISQATRDDFLARFPRLDPARMSAVPLAPAPHFRPQTEDETARVRAAYGLSPEFGLYVGSNKPHKNLERLVSAWGRLEGAPPLVIAGAWDPRYPLAAEADRLLGPDRIRLLGRIPEEDLPALYSACRLFVFPSLYEGFGLPVVEALACGAAVACSRTSSLPEVGGDAVVYFDPADATAMQAALAGALASPPDPEWSRRQAAAFSWERTAAATLEIYRSVAAAGLAFSK